jgi:hypothetical protein
MTTPAMVAIKNLSAKIIYQTCGPNIPITLLTHPKIPHPSLPFKEKKMVERNRNMQKLTRAAILKDAYTYQKQLLFHNFAKF